MTNYDAYPYIVAWGRLTGAYSSYIRDQVDLAEAEGAPPHAIYRRSDGTWATTETVTSSATRRELGLQPLVPREPDLPTMMLQLRNAVWWTELFRDLFGMTEVRQQSERTLIIQFATGWSVRLTLDPLPPETST
jgi:hypothetical protein